MQTSTMITIFQVLVFFGTGLAFFSAIGLWHYSRQLEAEKKATIVALETKVETARTKVVSASATVNLALIWSIPGQSWKSVTTGTASYVAFGRGAEILLVLRSRHVVMEATSADHVSFTAFCDLNAPDSLVRASLRDLGKADVLQVATPKVPNGVVVESGTVKMTLNGNQELVIPVSKTVVQDEKIVVAVKDMERALGQNR